MNKETKQEIIGIVMFHGENDYVSPLGNQIIPEDHVTYIRTPVQKGNFAGYHDITYMFATLVLDRTTGNG